MEREGDPRLRDRGAGVYQLERNPDGLTMGELSRQCVRLMLDVIAEQRRYIEIEAGYTDALKQLYDAVAEVERATGLPLH